MDKDREVLRKEREFLITHKQVYKESQVLLLNKKEEKYNEGETKYYEREAKIERTYNQKEAELEKKYNSLKHELEFIDKSKFKFNFSII